MKINSRLIWESLRIGENQGLDLFMNQWELIPDLFDNHQESATINENQGLDLFKNQFQTYMRIIKNQQESMKIAENEF